MNTPDKEPLMPFFAMALAMIVLLLLFFVTCAEAQSYSVRPDNTGGYIITPRKQRKAHTPIDQWYTPGASTGARYSAPSTSAGLTTTLTPHYIMYQQDGATKGYAGFYQAMSHCESTRKIIAPVMRGRLWCEYVR